MLAFASSRAKRGSPQRRRGPWVASPLAFLAATLLLTIRAAADASFAPGPKSWAAHGAAPLKVVETIVINAPPERVWTAVSDFAHYDWLPGVARVEASGGNKPEQARRSLHMKDGGSVEESLVKWDAEKMTLAFHRDHDDMKRLPAVNYMSHVTVKPAEDGKTLAEWKGRFYRGHPFNDPPPELNDDTALAAVTALHRANLVALKAKVEEPAVAPTRSDEAFVTAQGADVLNIVDLMEMRSVSTIPIGGKPAGIAVSLDGARAYVTSPEGKLLTVVDAKARKIEKQIKIEGGPLGVAVAPDGTRVYVADLYGKRLIEIDSDSGAITRSVGVGAMASGVAVTPDGKTILVADRDEDAVSVIDATSFTRVAVIPVGKHPFGLAIDAAGARAYSANVQSDTVSVIEIAARKVIATLKTGQSPYAVALAGGRVFVADQHSDSVSVFEEISLKPLGSVKVGEYPEGIAASGDGKSVYVACWFSNELWAIDALSLKITGKAEAGDGPRAFGSFIRPAK